jgi:hypothetical protein
MITAKGVKELRIAMTVRFAHIVCIKIILRGSVSKWYYITKRV